MPRSPAHFNININKPNDTAPQSLLKLKCVTKAAAGLDRVFL